MHVREPVYHNYKKGWFGILEILKTGKYSLFLRHKKGNFTGPAMELVRFAVPRRVYTKSHIEYTAEAIAEVYQKKENLRGMKMTYEAPFLRHFTAKFEYA